MIVRTLRWLALALLSVLSPGAGCDDPSGKGDTFSVVTVRVSVRADGTELAGISSVPAISPDGRFVAFESDATDLTVGDINGVVDIFVKDRVTGIVENYTLKDTNNNYSAEDSRQAAISADAQYLAFASKHTFSGNLITHQNLFRKDRTTGVFVRFFTDSPYLDPDQDCHSPSMSDDGQRVCFATSASNVGFTPGGNPQIYVADFATDPPTIILVSHAPLSTTVGCNGYCANPRISGNGRFVAFDSQATNLSGADADATADVYVADLNASPITFQVASMVDAVTKANGFCGRPDISFDGRYVSFETVAANLAPAQVARRDMVSLTTAPAISPPSPSIFSMSPRMSADGRWVTVSTGSQLVNPPDGTSQAYVRDMQGGITQVSLNNFGLPSDRSGVSPVLSADGRWVAFYSFATNLVVDDLNSAFDVFVRGPLH